MVDFIIENKFYWDWFFFIVRIFLSLYIGYKIMRKIRESDYTFKTIRSVGNGITVTDAMNINLNKEKVPFYMRFKTFADIYQKTANRLMLVDEQRTPVIVFVMVLKYIVPIGLFISMFISPERSFSILLAIVLIEVIPHFLIKRSIKDHEKKFEAHAYELFKYINNQKSAGVTTHKIITKLHKVVVSDEKLKNRLISFAAEYVTHNDYDVAVNNHILKYYATADALALDNALRLGLEIGDAFTDTEGYENLMFNKYLNTVDYETEKKKMHSVFSAFMFTVPTVLLIGYILYVDIGQGLTTIFSK